MRPDCVFCDKIEDEPLIWNHNGTVCWFEPLNPVVPGHTLFVPRTHVRDAAERPEITGKVYEAAAEYARMHGLNEYDREFNLITSAGLSATQSVFHLHVHYIPRHENDGLHLPWTGQHA